MGAWQETVKKVFSQNKHKPGYNFKQALMDAKKIYKSGTNTVSESVSGVKNILGRIIEKNKFTTRKRRRSSKMKTSLKGVKKSRKSRKGRK
jgi:hypothetical protein